MKEKFEPICWHNPEFQARGTCGPSYDICQGCTWQKVCAENGIEEAQPTMPSSKLHVVASY